MAEFERNEREQLELDIAWEKREKKILLICSAVCCGLGLIIGTIVGISEGGIENIIIYIFVGMWAGTGVGGALSYVPGIPYAFKKSMKEEGFGGALKSTLLGILIWFLIFWIIGPVGLLIRVLMRNHKIKKLQKRLGGIV